MNSCETSDNPGLAASSWQAGSEGGTVLFEMAYGTGSRRCRGIGLVTKDSGSRQAVWFNSFARSTGYSQDRGISMREVVVASLALGSASQPPANVGAARSTVEEIKSQLV